MNIVLCIIFHGIQFEVQFSNCIFVFFQLKTIHIVLWEQYTLFYVVFHLAVFKSKGRRTFLQLFTASCLTVSISSSRRAIALFRSSTFKTRNNERNSAQKLLLHILTSGILILRLSRTLLSKSLPRSRIPRIVLSYLQWIVLSLSSVKTKTQHETIV
jgi:hypothetical protein